MNKMMTLTPSQFVNKVLMKIKVYSALSPADTHAHLFPDVSLVSAAPEDLTPHIGGAGPGLQEGPCGPHLLPCPPCWDNWVPCSPPCVPSHPNRRGQGVMGWSGGQAAASCMLAPGLPEWGHSSVQGARSRPRVVPGGETPARSLKEDTWGGTYWPHHSPPGTWAQAPLTPSLSTSGEHSVTRGEMGWGDPLGAPTSFPRN